MSATKAVLTMNGAKYDVAPPFEGAKYAVVKGVEKCPGCGEKEMRVQGAGMHIADREHYEAEAVTVCCKKIAGTLRAKVSTIFGLEEDEAVLKHGRCRVYY